MVCKRVFCLNLIDSCIFWNIKINLRFYIWYVNVYIAAFTSAYLFPGMLTVTSILHTSYNMRIVAFTSAYVLDLRLAIDPPPPRGNFVHYDFLKLQYISHKMRHVSPLRVEALSCNNNITYVTL